MEKPVIALGVNNTLTASRRPVSRELCRMIQSLLRYYTVCILSGDTFEQIDSVLLSQLDISHRQREHLVVLPTNGMRVYKYSARTQRWRLLYNETIDAAERKRIIAAITQAAKALDMWPERPRGEVIEDRGSQVSFAALGMNATATQKYYWAEQHERNRSDLCRKVARMLPEYDVKLSGMTSLDVRPQLQRRNRTLLRSLNQLGLLDRPLVYVGGVKSSDALRGVFRHRNVQIITVEGAQDTRYVLDGVLATARLLVRDGNK